MHTKEDIKNGNHANKGKRDPNDLGRSPNPLASPCLHKVSSATQWDTTQKNQHKFLTSEQNHFPIACSVNNDKQILQLNLLSNFSFKKFRCEHSSRNLILRNFFIVQRPHKKSSIEKYDNQNCPWVHANIFACSNFLGIEPSIDSGTKIQHFQSPTHLLVLLFTVRKIQVTYNNNRDATWQGQKPKIALWFYTLLNGNKIQNNIQSINVVEAVKHAIHKQIPLYPECITKEIGQCTDSSVQVDSSLLAQKLEKEKLENFQVIWMKKNQN